MTEEEIIIMIRTGGAAREAGVKALYQTSGQAMLRFFSYQGVASGDAQDVLQDTLVKIVRNAEGFSATGTAKAWIWQIARNCLNDYQRKQVSLGKHEISVDDEQRKRLEETTAGPTPIDATTDGAVEKCVIEGLSHFTQKEPERAYALMQQMEGMSIADIGERIGRTVSATKEYLSQCKKKIQPYIAHCTQHLEA